MAFRRTTLLVLFSTLLIDMIGLGMLIPIIPIIFTDPTSPSFLLHGYSTQHQYFISGLLIALFGVMQFIAAPILGELSDIFGRKKLLMLGIGVLAISQLVFGFGIATASVALLLVSRAVAGLAGANFSIVQAAIADVSSPEDRAKNFGLIGAAFGIGFILGPLLGGWIAGLTGDAAAPFWVAGALGVINMLSVFLFLPETHKERPKAHGFHLLTGVRNLKAAFSDVDARPVYLANFFYMSGFAFFTSFVGIFVVQRFGFSEADVGTFFGVVGIWIVVTQLVVLRIITRRFRERAILRVTIPIIALSLISYPFLPSSVYLYVLLPILAIPQGLTMANMTALVSKSVSAGKQGAALGINGSLIAFSQGIVPLVAGLGSGIIGIHAPFFAGALLALAAWATLFVFMRREPKA